LPVRDVQALHQVASTLARVLGWGSAAANVNYYGDVNTVVVCDEARRKHLIEQRQRLLEAEASGRTIELNGHKAKAAVPVAIPAPETQPDASVGAGNDTIAQKPPPVVQKDSVFQHMKSIGRAASWRSEAEHHAGMFGPYPEELE
jgi:hypothetical protein